MNSCTRRQFTGSLLGAAAATALHAQQAGTAAAIQRAAGVKIKITDLRCAIIGRNPVIRITTDQGISGYGQAESAKAYLKPMVLFYKPYLVGADPTDVGRIMTRIRRLGAFKPWGAAVSAIEIALWDIAGQAAGQPVYRLLGGKIRDRVMAYGNSENKTAVFSPKSPQQMGEIAAQMKEAKEGFKLVKMPVAFHNAAMMNNIPDTWFGEKWTERAANYINRGPLTERGLDYILSCVDSAKKALGKDVDLALDCGPGWVLKDAVRFARAVEPHRLMWLEDVLTGDGDQYPNAQLFRDLKTSTSTPIHTGEELYLRENCKDLIETQAVDVLGPDPEDVGGIAELKWIAEYANLHGILVAPHGIFDGLFGVAAQVHLGAVCPQNYVGFEYAVGQPDWWYEIVDGLPNPIVKNGYIDVWDKPGLGVTFNVLAAKKHLGDEDKAFFD